MLGIIGGSDLARSAPQHTPDRGNEGCGGSDLAWVRTTSLVAAISGAAVLATLGGTSTTASAEHGCASPVAYSYAGYQSASRASGIRASIALGRAPTVEVGHVAGWVGVGGPKQGPDGADEWLQAGIAAGRNGRPFLYVETMRNGRRRVVVLPNRVARGISHEFAVVESRHEPGAWSAFVDGRRAMPPVVRAGSSPGWAPIATAESWVGESATCNSFAFRFAGVSVSSKRGSWRPLQAAHEFLDAPYLLHRARSARPYAFVAASG